MSNYFKVLGLSPSTSISETELKKAYRKALLRHHPDKSDLVHSVNRTDSTEAIPDPLSVDEIKRAYKALSDAKERFRHLRDIRLQSHNDRKGNQTPFTSVEVDLDDMSHDEVAEEWTRKCICSGVYTVTTGELEKVIDSQDHQGEILVPCSGCSRWIKVVFAVDEG